MLGLMAGCGGNQRHFFFPAFATDNEDESQILLSNNSTHMLKNPTLSREMVTNEQFPVPPKAAFNLPRSASSGFTGFPPPGNGNGNGNGTARILPPSSCSMRGRVTLREVASSISGSSGGLTLSESLRQSGKVFEEQEARVKQLSHLSQVTFPVSHVCKIHCVQTYIYVNFYPLESTEIGSICCAVFLSLFTCLRTNVRCLRVTVFCTFSLACAFYYMPFRSKQRC
jgi:hypothetical protein